MRQSILLFVLFSLCSCGNKDSSTQKGTSPESSEKSHCAVSKSVEPESSTDFELSETEKLGAVIAVAKGDLDKDGISEKVEIKNSDEEEKETGEITRAINIFKKDGSSWKLWHSSTGPVLSNESGGMMGDPFAGVSVERGCIVISHYGGAADRWEFTDRYRFQNGDWYLIGESNNTFLSFNPDGDYSNSDFNLSTGCFTIEKSNSKNDENGDRIEGSAVVTKYSGQSMVYQNTKMDGYEPGTIKLPCR